MRTCITRAAAVSSVLLAALAGCPAFAVSIVIPNEPRLESPPALSFDGFGESLAVFGRTALIGAPEDDSSIGTSILDDTGAAYLYEADGAGVWRQVDVLAGSGLRRSRFGFAVALSDGVAVVGEPPNNSTAPNRRADSNLGRAFIYQRDGTQSWGRRTFLQPTGMTPFSGFGSAVAASRGVVAVAAPGQAIGGDARAGTVIVYEKQGDQFLQQPTARLTASAPGPTGRFGAGVAIVDDQIVVGDANGLSVFEKTADEWRLAQEVASTPFPFWDVTSMASFGDTVVVGNRFDDTGGNNSGAAYVFQRDATGQWSNATTLLPDSADSSFGTGVAIWGDSILVGAFADDQSALNAGAAYLYERDTAGEWTRAAKYLLENAQEFNNFGLSVGLMGDTALVATSRSLDPNRGGTGSVLVFKVPEPTACLLSLLVAGWVPVCRKVAR